MSTASVVGFTQAIVNLNSAGFIGLLTTIPKLIAGVISLTAAFGASEVAALGLKGVLDLLKIDPVVLAISALIAVAGGAAFAYSKLTTSLKEHQQMLEDAKSSYNDIVSQLESVNSELQTTKDRISELEGYDTLSFSDEEELTRLRSTNDELERQQHLLEQQQKEASKVANKEFVATMSSDLGQVGEKKSSSSNQMDANGHYHVSFLTEQQYIQEQISAYKDALAQRNTALKSSDEEAASQAEKDMERIYSYLSGKRDELLGDASGIAYIQNPTSNDEKNVNKWLDFINNLQNNLAILSSQEDSSSESANNYGTAMTDAFKWVANKSEFSDVVKEIQGLGESVDLSLPKYKDFIQALIDTGFIPDASTDSLETVSNAINDIGESSNKLAALNLAKSLSETTTVLSRYEATFDSFFSNGEVTDNFKSLFGDNKTDEEIKEQISRIFSSASDSVQTGIFDIIKRVRDGKEDYQSAMSDFALVGANEINSIGDQLASALTSSAFGDLDGLDGMIDSWSELSSTLKETASCMDLVKSAQEEMNATGSISISTALDLISKNSDYADILKIDTNGAISLVDNAEQVLIGTKINAIKASAQQQLADARAAVKSLESAEKFKDTAQTIKNDVIPVYSAFSGSAAYLGSIFSDIFSGNFSGILDRAKTSMQSALNEANSKIVDISKDSGELAQARKDLEDATKFNNIAQNLTIDNFSKKYSPTSIKNTNSKDIEEYVADIDRLYSGKEKLVEIQNEIKRLSSINDITDSDVEKVQNLNQIIILYKQEQDALHALNQERRNEISAQVDTLKSQGFDVLYDPDSNKLVINNLEHINKLQGKTTEETNEIRKAAEKLIDTVQSENSDAIQSSQDWLGVLKNINGAYNDIKQSAKDALEESQKGLEDDINSIKSTVNKAFDEISKLLSKEKESYETQKSNLESVAGTVTSYINTYTDSLQSENDELEKQISLQQKLESLDKAKTQRNKRIFKSGKGFIWGADESAVNSAQEEYDSALKEYNLNKQIQELKDYAKAWQDAVNSYETSANEALTASILGSNWRSKVLGTKYSLVRNFKSDYTEVLSELDDSVYGSVAYQIKNLDNLKDEWSNAVDEAEDTSTDYKTVLDLVKTYESSNYSDRLNEMSKFVTSMKEQYKELTAAYQTVTAAIPTATSGSIQYDKDENYAQKILDSTTLSEAQAYAALRNAKISGENITDVSSTQSFLDTWEKNNSSKNSSLSSSSSSSSKSSSASSVAKSVVSAIGSVVSTISKSILGFSDGGVVRDTGLAMLHGGSGHNEIVLNSDDASSLWRYVKSTDVLSQSAANLLVSSSLSSGNNITPNSNQSISLNIGDIYLSGINDSNSLADEIVRKLPAAVLQKIYSKKKRR